MVDLWARDTGIMLIITLPAVLVVLPMQLLLCFKARRRWVKRLPAILFAALTPALYAVALMVHDWSAFVYLILAVFSGVVLLFCGLAWGIYAIVTLVKKISTMC